MHPALATVVLDDPHTALLSDDEKAHLTAHESTIHATDFILRWTAYGASRTDAPTEFHQACGLVLVSTAINRNRWLDLQHKRIHPSLYILLLAGSGLRKSTPLRYAADAISAGWVEHLLANDYSPEALVQDLAGRNPSRGVAFVDEAGKLLATMRRNGYGEGLKDLLSELWDAPEIQSRKLVKGTYTLHSSYVTLVMATTPSRFAETVVVEDVASGFLARFLPVLVTSAPARKPLEAMRPAVKDAGDHLCTRLVEIRNRLATAPTVIPITPAALTRLDHLEQDLAQWATRQYHVELVEPWTRRLAEYACRLAIVFAVSEGQDEVDVPHVLRAVVVIDRAKDDVGQLVEELTRGKAARALERVERFILANPGISARDVQRHTTYWAKDVEALGDELEAQGRVRVKRGERRQRWYYPPDPTTPTDYPTVNLSSVSIVSTEGVGEAGGLNGDGRARARNGGGAVS